MLNLRGTRTASRYRNSETIPLPFVHIYSIKNLCFLCSRVSTPEDGPFFFLVDTAGLLARVLELLTGCFRHQEKFRLSPLFSTHDDSPHIMGPVVNSQSRVTAGVIAFSPHSAGDSRQFRILIYKWRRFSIGRALAKLIIYTSLSYSSLFLASYPKVSLLF